MDRASIELCGSVLLALSTSSSKTVTSRENEPSALHWSVWVSLRRNRSAVGMACRRSCSSLRRLLRACPSGESGQKVKATCWRERGAEACRTRKARKDWSRIRLTAYTCSSPYCREKPPNRRIWRSILGRHSQGWQHRMLTVQRIRHGSDYRLGANLPITRRRLLWTDFSPGRPFAYVFGW